MKPLPGQEDTQALKALLFTCILKKKRVVGGACQQGSGRGSGSFLPHHTSTPSVGFPFLIKVLQTRTPNVSPLYPVSFSHIHTISLFGLNRVNTLSNVGACLSATLLYCLPPPPAQWLMEHTLKAHCQVNIKVAMPHGGLGASPSCPQGSSSYLLTPYPHPVSLLNKMEWPGLYSKSFSTALSQIPHFTFLLQPTQQSPMPGLFMAWVIPLLSVPLHPAKPLCPLLWEHTSFSTYAFFT